MDDTGTARTSDVFAAAQWILANKDKYNIKVANFSLHASNSSSFTHDPLDKAVEKLWFSGVTVVAAAGKDRKSTRLNSSHSQISYAVFCLKKKILTSVSD